MLSQHAPGSSTTPALGSPRNYPQPYVMWNFNEFWHGISLNLPGGGSQSLLVADVENVGKPSLGGPYHWTTKNDWWFSCLDQTANGQPGEAFVGHSPSGETYYFDQLSERRVSQLWERICVMDGIPPPGVPPISNPCDHRRIARKEVMLLPTRIEDRFGNWVEYHWSNDTFSRLNSISSSDGRAITLHYDANGIVDRVSDGSRQWSYQYHVTEDVRVLHTVVLPDQSTWQYALTGLPVEGTAQSCYDMGEEFYCYAPDVYSAEGYGYVVHPSGAKVEFWAKVGFKPTENGVGWGGGSYPLRLTRKRISGPGLSAAEWQYSYWPDRSQFLAECGPTRTTCPKQIYVDAKGPDGSMTRSYFGIEPWKSQGMLMSEQRGKLNGGTFDVLSTTTYTYADPNVANGFEARVGTLPQESDDGLPNEYFYPQRRIPIQVRTVSQQGATFTSSITDFNEFAQPEVIVRSSSGLAGPAPGYSRTEATTYHHDTSKWVIGLPKKTESGGYVVSETIYNADALPQTVKKFGAVQAHFAYNANGTIASVTDGNGKSTTLANWHRGIPRNISFPVDSGAPETQSATVDDVGNVSTTVDELGTTTTYGYDVMGRLASIGYQAETSPAQTWNPLARGFSFVPCNAIGILSNCWRQTVSTGSGSAHGKTTTWYDARFQPVLTLTEDTSNSDTKSYVERRFDAFGRETFVSYPVASASVGSAVDGTVTEYDALGRPTAVKQASELGTLTTTTVYLPGLQTRVTNPKESSTTTSYQVFDNPAETSPTRIEAPAGVTTTIVRDTFGAPLSITRAGPGG